MLTTFSPLCAWRALIALFTLGLLLPLTAGAMVSQPTREQQRVKFLHAEQALKLGRISRFKKLEAELHDYPLYLYLQYASLRRRLGTASDTELLEFFNLYRDSPLSGRLHTAWLHRLAKNHQWQRLVDQFQGSTNSRLLCSYAHALQKTGNPQPSYKIIDDLWLSAKSLPPQCNQPINAWKKAGRLSQEQIWQRIRLAMRKGRVRLAQHLAEDLPKEERFWVNIWKKVRRDPNYVLELHTHFNQEHRPRALSWITIYALRRQAGRHPLDAAANWQRLKARYSFDANEIERIESRLALALLNHRSAEAQVWLKNLKLSHEDARVISLHFFSAMQDHDWDTALAWLERIKQSEQHTDRWRYWRGRVLEAMGRLEEARSVYLLNGETRGYYNFLAADRAGQRYRFSDVPLHYNVQELADLSALPAIQRAQELMALKRVVDARREWNYTISRLPYEKQLKAAKLAEQWGWHDRVISTLAQAKYWDDLEMRFPLAHQKLVLRQATQQHINPAWAFAIIRQESAFTPDARSHAGALGLMQLLPRTARSIARTLRLRRPRRSDLLRAETNIRLGVGYLKKVFDRYNGHPVLATAAYNAGPHRVKRWLPEHGSVAADVWIEKVPFKETRKYLKRVLTYTVIYEQRLGRKPVPLLERLTPITLGMRVKTTNPRKNT